MSELLDDLIPDDECPAPDCGDMLNFDYDAGDRATCPSCGRTYPADGEGGYGDDGQGFRWWRTSEEEIR